MEDVMSWQGIRQHIEEEERRGAAGPAQLASPPRLELPASERSAARRGLTLRRGAENEVPVIS